MMLMLHIYTYTGHDTLYEDLMGALENKKEVFESMMMTQMLRLDVVFELIIRAFSKIINDKLVHQGETRIEFCLAYIVEKVGELISDATIYYTLVII